MAIEKKIKLYVSDTTGERKVAKYYRIPLVGDSLPYNETTNPLKDVLRIYMLKFQVTESCSRLLITHHY